MGPADVPLSVCVAYSPQAGEIDEVQLALPSGATVLDALSQSGLLQRHAGIDVAAARIGVWSKLRALDHVLRDRDRVEVYRPLLVDPKEARRLRYRKHRERTKD
jgi:putative ubiquitin-RnfH superfamily antitoxin RatB of RatAB toxin-antitoxin module